MQIISTAPPNPSRNRVRMNMGKEVEKAPTITAQVSRQDRDTVHLPQLHQDPSGHEVA